VAAVKRASRVIDTGHRAFPCPDNRSGDLQAFAVLELQQAVLAEIDSARRLVRAAEQTAGPDRQRTLLALLESIDVALVNIGICADDSAEMADQIARTLRTLTLDSRIASEWASATNRRAV